MTLKRVVVVTNIITVIIILYNIALLACKIELEILQGLYFI